MTQRVIFFCQSHDSFKTVSRRRIDEAYATGKVPALGFDGEGR